MVKQCLARCRDDSLPVEASPSIPDTDIREAHHSILRAFIMFCTGDWGRVFTWHNVYIIQTRILPPSCQHCWNLQRLLDLSETTLFHLRPLVMASWQGEVGWHGQAVLILLPPLSCIRCSGALLKVDPSQPPICGPCAQSLGMSHCLVFPIISPSPDLREHANFHSALSSAGRSS